MEYVEAIGVLFTIVFGFGIFVVALGMWNLSNKRKGMK